MSLNVLDPLSELDHDSQRVSRVNNISRNVRLSYKTHLKYVSPIAPSLSAVNIIHATVVLPYFFAVFMIHGPRRAE